MTSSSDASTMMDFCKIPKSCIDDVRTSLSTIGHKPSSFAAVSFVDCAGFASARFFNGVRG